MSVPLRALQNACAERDAYREALADLAGGRFGAAAAAYAIEALEDVSDQQGVSTTTTPTKDSR